MKNSLFPSVREAVLVIVITAFFLILTAVCIGLRPEHFLMAGVFLLLFFAGQTTRKLAVALLPFFIFGISYDWMRVYPNYQVNPIDVKGLYEAEKSLFGLSVDGAVLIPCEYFALNHCPVADFFAGIFYLCWVPVPIAFGLWLYLKGDRKVYLRFAMVFLLVNLIGFAGYYIHPAAPPWYAMNYGFEPVLNTPGNVAGLGRFDELLGVLCLSFHLWTERQCICRCSFIACGLYGGGCSIRYYGTLQEMADSFVLCYHGGYLVDGCLFRTSLSD